MTKFPLLIFIFLFVPVVAFAQQDQCPDQEAFTGWYCADIRGCSAAQGEADNMSPPNCYPPGECEDMGTNVSTEYRVTEDEADEDANTDISCTKECRIKKIRSCLN